MANEPKRPTLRVVAPDEAPEPQRDDAKLPSTPPRDSGEPSHALVAFSERAERFDASVPIKAAYLACAGCWLAEAALAFHHQAVAHAPADTFRHDTPPGLKSAEATRAWLQTHIDALKKAAAAEDRPSAYLRANDLRAAVLLAAEDLDRALTVARTAGLWFEERHENLFKDATEDLDSADAIRATAQPTRPAEDLDIAIAGQELPSLWETYWFGADVLAGAFARPRVISG